MELDLQTEAQLFYELLWEFGSASRVIVGYVRVEYCDSISEAAITQYRSRVGCIEYDRRTDLCATVRSAID